MADVLAAVDSTTGAFGPLVQNRLRADMQTAINTGVTTAITGMGDIVAAVNAALVPLSTTAALQAANILPTAHVNALTGWFHCDGYGAVGNGTTIDTTALQAAITAANTRYVATGVRQKVYLPPRVHLVDAVNYVSAVSGTVTGAVSLMLLDGVDFFGPGTLRVKAGAYGPGANYGVIRSKDTGLSHASVKQITIEGNKENNTASVQCNNIILEALIDVEVSDTTQISANGNAIMIRGTTSVPAQNIKINRNDVTGATAIGIQASQFDGLEIDGNTVAYTNDNCIDIYGENGTANSNGVNWRISNNRVRNGANGIFPETVANGLVANNTISGCVSAGIHVNRINGQPVDILITGNKISGCPIGAYFTGDTGGVTFRGNTVFGASNACVQMGGGGGRVSYIYILDNTLDTAVVDVTPLVLIATNTNQAVSIVHRGTITRNTTRSWDTINAATSNAGNRFSPSNAT